MGAVQTYARQAWGNQATDMGTEGTLHSPLWTVECQACAWVMLSKSAISKVDRMILFCCSKRPKYNSWGDLAYN